MKLEKSRREFGVRGDEQAKARYVLNLYAASLAPSDTHNRDLVAAVIADLNRLFGETSPD